MTLFKEYRIKEGIKQQKMADKMKMPIWKYQRIENARRNPSPKEIMDFLNIRKYDDDIKLANILDEIIKEGWYDEK